MKSLVWTSDEQIKKSTNTEHDNFMEKDNIAWWACAFNSWHC